MRGDDKNHLPKGTIMHTPLTHKGPTHHPMMIIAAIAIILFCLAGTAAILGWIPSSIGSNTAAGRGDLTEADRVALAAKLDAPAAAPYQAPVQQLAAPPQPVQNLAPEPRPVQTYAPAARPVQNYVPEPRPIQREAAYRPVQVAAAAPARNWCANCGNVESIREINTRAQGSGVGAAGGAILGGLLGNQVGGGHGRQLATVAGAVGGAVVGNQVEGNMKATRSYEIRVRLDDGSARTFHQQNAPGWHQGDRVRVVKGVLHSVR
jgi:outer membrane lipoprotein SlyB